MRCLGLVAACITSLGGAALAQDAAGVVTITGWGSSTPLPVATPAPPPAATWTQPSIVADGHPASDAVAPRAEQSGDPKHWTRLAAEPVVSATEVRAGEALLTFQVAHLYTGHLVAEPDRVAGALSGVRIIPAGSPVYGLPLNGEFSWCAPRKVALKGGSRWDADCFVPHWLYPGLYSHGSSTGQGLLVASARGNGGAIRTPVVRTGPVDFGEYPSLYYRFGGWEKRSVRIKLDAGGNRHTKPIDYIWAPREPDGSAVLKVLDGELRLVPAGEGLKSVRIEVIRPPSRQASSPL